MTKLKLFGSSKTETTEPSGEKVNISKKHKIRTRRKGGIPDHIGWGDEYERIFNYEKNLITFVGEPPRITIVSASTDTHPVIKYLSPLAEKCSFLKLIEINHLSRNWRYQISASNSRQVRSGCYDLSDPNSAGYGKFYEDLNSAIGDTDLVIVFGQDNEENYQINKMPMLTYGEVPTVYFIDEEPYFENSKIKYNGLSLIYFSTRLIENWANISSDYELVNHQLCLNKAYAKTIELLIKKIHQTAQYNIENKTKGIVQVKHLACTWEAVKEVFIENDITLRKTFPYPEFL